jgi:hypothetical protein
MTHYYKSFFTIDETYKPIMRREHLFTSPEMWLNFYPHPSFVEFLRSLLKQMDSGKQSVWLTGAFGTGKTFAALVLQKLFSADDTQFEQYFEKRKNEFSSDTVYNSFKKFREDGVLAVFETGSTAIDAKDQFFMRIESAIVRELKTRNLNIPSKGELSKIIERLEEEGDNFFKTRNFIQDRLANLTSSYKKTADIIKGLENEELRDGLLRDTLQVFRERSIWLDLSSQSLLEWVGQVLEQNGLKKLVFIWDEFSSFVERNRNELRTLEELAEAAQDGKFYFVPVTHMNIDAYLAIGSESAKKANDRFEFRKLDMPDDTAFKLAADAFQIVPQMKEQWEEELSTLWLGIKDVVDIHFRNVKDLSPESFKKILPIHPVAAFVLKHLSTLIGSNQRSLFDYLKGNDNGAEFQEFIETGGPAIPNKQYLTVDHLWKYFIERDDLGLNQEVRETRIEFNRHNNLTIEQQRIFRTMLLFNLLSQFSKDGNELLEPTKKNIVESFKGDGSILGVEQVLEQLKDKQCFSIVNERCVMFRSNVNTTDLETEKDKLRLQFNALVLDDKTKNVLESKIRSFNANNRFVVRVGSVDSLTNIPKRESFASNSGNQILVQFILAKDNDEQLRIPEKVESLVKQFSDYRIVFLTMPLTFCDNDTKNWEKYIEQYAQIQLTTDVASKNAYKRAIELFNEDWKRRLTDNTQTIYGCKPTTNGEIEKEELTWNTLRNYLLNFIKQTLPDCVDEYSGYSQNALGSPTALQQWAKAGINFQGTGATKQGISAFKQKGIIGDPAWFDSNPQHPLTKMRNLCLDKRKNTVGKNNPCSIRKIYIELQRSPFGLQYVSYSAFVMGFILKEWLNENLQWTNGQITKPLDVDSLAEIIEKVVQDDGQNKIKDEKLICRLSKDEKAFVEHAGEMFGFEADKNGSVVSILNAIQNRISNVSNKIPLWVLPDYIDSKNRPLAKELRTIIENLCLSFRTSASKKNVEEHVNYITEVGTLLLQHDELANEFASFIQTDEFEYAFRFWIDNVEPSLKQHAEKVGDLTSRYSQTLKEKCVQEAGWLWNQTDYSNLLSTVKREYEIIGYVKLLIDCSTFLSYKDAISKLHDAVFNRNKVPCRLITQRYPTFGTFFESLAKQDNEDISMTLLECLQSAHKTIRELFFDTSAKQIQIDMLAGFLQDVPSAKEILTAIYQSLPTGVQDDENVYLEIVRNKIQEHWANSLAEQIKSVWKEKTKTESPDDWSSQYKLPARLLFKDMATAAEIQKVIKNSSDFTPQKSATLLTTVKQWESPTTDNCQNRFIDECVPSKYCKLQFNAADLCRFLEKHLGKPNDWQYPTIVTEVEKFIHEQYQQQFKEQAIEKIQALSDKELKETLIRCAENPDIGLLILEK